MKEEIKLLVVDDDEVDTLIIKKSLKTSSIVNSIDTAELGRVAISLLLQNKYACIFIDYQLPDMNGIELLKTIRAKGINTPAIIITSQGDEATAVLAIKAGASDYISKTMLTTEGLAQSLRNALKAREIEIERDRAQNELAKAKEIAENSLKIKEQFLANMSHEIRTPMNGIMGITELLLDTTIDNAQKEYLLAIKKSSENLLIIINDILDFSKIESGNLTIEETPFDIRSLVKSVLNLLGAKSSEKNIVLRSHIDNNIPESLIGDPLRINQILINLVGNAIKFTPQGKISVDINMIKKELNIVALEIKIIDSGIGIPKEKLETIFESFSQVSTSTSRKFGGSGLGLTISKKLTELMGGTICAQSEIGKGSTFLINIPLKADSISPLIEQTENLNNPSIDFSGLKILVAEDHPVNQLLIKSLLKKWNADFEIVGNGLIASERLKTKSYDLVLADIQMPEMDGYELTDFIRKNIGDKNKLPIIAMTANAFEDEKDRCIAAGMNDYISKPFKFEDLNRKIAAIISRPSEIRKTLPVSQTFDFTKSKINLDYLHEFSGGDKLFEKEMIELFISNSIIELDNIEEAIKNRQFKIIKTIAHKLKSSVLIVGLSMLEKPLLTLEADAATEANINNIEKNFIFVKKICLQAIEELKILLPDYLK